MPFQQQYFLRILGSYLRLKLRGCVLLHRWPVDQDPLSKRYRQQWIILARVGFSLLILTFTRGYKDSPGIVLRGQTAYFSFDMGVEKNKGLVYYRCMFCAENHQILAIVDRLKIGVNSLQRRSNDAHKL